MRQRLSSEPDRYRGRRRVPTPPRSRYAAVVTSAFVGAGIVALGAAANLPDMKTVSPDVLQGMQSNFSEEELQQRTDDAERTNRSDRTTSAKTAKVDAEAALADIYVLPLDDYQFTAPFGVRFGKLHAGIDLAAPEGTPYKAVHAGTVTSAGYNGGYGYSITVQQEDGTEIIYAHSRQLLVKKGDQVKAGQVIGEVGNTGYSYGTHLHLEVHTQGKPTDPIVFLKDRDVDIKMQMDSEYAAVAVAEAAAS